MSSNDHILLIENISKCFEIYEKPEHRLYQMFLKNRKLYNEFWALNDISFNFKRGESVGIIGRNGAGKSTLLQIICNTLSPTSGHVSVRGKVAALLELGAGFNPEFSGEENIYMCASLYGMTKEEIDSRYQDIIDFADIGNFINQPVKTYSSGMYVRLAFAVIAHVDAEILIIDEALAVGDALFTQKCMRFLREFKKNGVLLFVSHDTSAVTNLCDKAVWLKNGRLESFGSAKSVTEMYMADLYQSNITKVEKTLETVDRPDARVFRDFRQDFINNSTLRNDIQVVQFDDSESNSFGKGGAHISDVCLRDETGDVLSWFVGGECVSLIIEVAITSHLKSPIVGFTVKDKLGQAIFGDNTYIHTIDEDLSCYAGNKMIVAFDFQMPILINGDYSVSVAVADGDQNSHVQHHWINDAVLFKSTATSASTGLVGIPMKKIEIDIK